LFRLLKNTPPIPVIFAIHFPPVVCILTDLLHLNSIQLFLAGDN
jgi:uncharacterized membrane protein